MDDRNAPATRGDIADILEAVREVETKLLKAFYGYAKSNVCFRQACEEQPDLGLLRLFGENAADRGAPDLQSAGDFGLANAGSM
jgi:hypothetical protein